MHEILHFIISGSVFDWNPFPGRVCVGCIPERGCSEGERAWRGDRPKRGSRGHRMEGSRVQMPQDPMGDGREFRFYCSGRRSCQRLSLFPGYRVGFPPTSFWPQTPPSVRLPRTAVPNVATPIHRTGMSSAPHGTPGPPPPSCVSAQLLPSTTVCFIPYVVDYPPPDMDARSRRCWNSAGMESVCQHPLNARPNKETRVGYAFTRSLWRPHGGGVLGTQTREATSEVL